MVAVTVPLVLLGGASKARPAAPAPTTATTVAAYDTAPGGTGEHNHWLLNPRTGRYQNVYRIDRSEIMDLLVAPDGRNVLVSRFGHCADRQWGVLPVQPLADGRISRLRWLPCGPGTPLGGTPSVSDVGAQWSRDRRKVLVATGSKERPAFRIYDTSTGRLGPDVVLHVAAHEQVLVWGRTAGEVAVGPRENDDSVLVRVRYLSATDGHLVGTASVLGGLFDDGDLGDDGFHRMQPSSDGGGYLLAAGGRITDNAVRRITIPRTGDNGLEPMGWIDARHFAGFDDATFDLWIVDTGGRIARHLKLPANTAAMPTGHAHGGILPQFASSSAYPAGAGVQF